MREHVTPAVDAKRKSRARIDVPGSAAIPCHADLRGMFLIGSPVSCTPRKGGIHKWQEVSKARKASSLLEKEK